MGTGRPASQPEPQPLPQKYFFEVVELQRWVSGGMEGGGNGEKVRKVHWLVPLISAEKPLMATQPYKAGFGF